MIGLLIYEFKIYDVYGYRDLSPDVNGDGQITAVDWIKVCPCYDVHQEWLLYLREMALVPHNYAYAQIHDGASISPALHNLCRVAEEYLKVEYEVFDPLHGAFYGPIFDDYSTGEYNPNRDDNASFTLMNNPNDTNPVPPIPPAFTKGDEDAKQVSQKPLYKHRLGGWRGMNWRRCGWS